jgi:hypothetical protein
MADLTMLKQPLIAVDTNVLIDLADDNEVVIDCFSTISRKFPKAPYFCPSYGDCRTHGYCD